MDKEITIRITGEAGQGIQTVGIALCNLFKSCGLHIFASQDYMSRVRGGNNSFQLRIADTPIYTLRQKSDITLALDKKSIALHRGDIADGGIIVLDKKKFDISDEDSIFLNVPFYDLANSAGGSDIFINTCIIFYIKTFSSS